ncbi:MAG: tetratricopeptide repeat protein [Algisphaera sp.]
MSISSHKRRQRRRTRLTLIASVLLLLVGGVAALYHVQKGRQQSPKLDPGPRDAAIAMVARGEHEAALEAFLPYFEARQTTPAMLKAWSQARLNTPLPDAQHISQAATQLRAVLRQNADDTEAAKQLLTLLSRYPQGVENEIITLTDKVLQHDASNTNVHRPRALGLASLKQYANALKSLKLFLADHPDDLQMQRLKLDMMNGEKQPHSVILTQAQHVFEALPDTALGSLTLAHAKLITGDRSGARPLLATAVTQSITDPQWVMQTVQMLDAAGTHIAVLPYLEQQFTAGPPFSQNPELVGELILRRFEAGRVGPSLELLDTGIALESLYMSSFEAIARHAIGQRDQARTLIRDLATHSTNRYRAAARLLNAALPENDSSPDTKAIIEAAGAIREHKVNIAYLDALIANAHQRQGQNEAAETAYKKALSQRPSWAGPCVGLAELYLSQNNQEQAYRYATAAGKREGRSLRVAVITARAAEARIAQLSPAQLAELSNIIDSVQNAQPGEPHTAVLKVNVLAHQGDTDGAANAARHAAHITPPLNEKTTLKLAAIARRHHLGVADELEAAYLERFGQTPRIAITRALETAAAGDNQTALDQFDASMPNNPNPEWLVNRALIYERLGHAEALDHWIQASESAPDNARVQKHVLTSAAIWTDRDLADRIINRLKKAAPNDNAWRIERARFLLTGNPQDPVATADQVDKLLNVVTKSSVPTLNVLVMQATSRRLKGDAQGAAQLLEKALQQNPSDPALQLELAQALASAGNQSRALNIIRQTLTQKNLPDQLLRTSHQLLQNLGDSNAASPLETLRDRKTANNQDLWLLVQHYRTSQRLNDAVALLPDLLANDGAPASAQAIALAADIYSAADQPDAARAALKQLDTLDIPETQKLTLHAAHAAASGSIDEAAAGFAAATAADPKNSAAWRNLVEFQLRAGQSRAALASAQEAIHAQGATPGIEALHAQSSVIQSLPPNPTLIPLYSAIVNGTPAARDAATQTLQTLHRLTTDPNTTPNQHVTELIALANDHPQIEAIEVLAIAALRHAGQPQSALQRATAAGERFPRSPSLAQALAQGYAQQSNWSQALIATNTWRRLVPGGSLAADTLAAQAHRHLGHADRALDVLSPYRSRILARPETTPVLTRQYTMLLAMANRTNESRDILKPLLPSSTYWRMTWLDVATQGIHDTRQAGRWIQDVEDVLDENQLIERSAIAQAWWALGRRDNHPAYLERARTRLANLAADPDANTDVWFFLGSIAEHDGDSATAAQHYRKALALTPNAVNVRNNLAMVLSNNPNATDDQLAEAINLAASVTTDRPQEPNYHDTHAAVLLTAKHYDQALAAIQHAIDLDPSNPEWRKRHDQITAAMNAGI